MTAKEAREAGHAVPECVPDVARLRQSGIQKVSDDEWHRIYRWEWMMALNDCDENGVPYPEGEDP